MTSPFLKLSLILVLLWSVAGCTQPKPEEPNPVHRKSPIAIAKTFHPPTDTYIKIVYGQPYKRGRDIFGQLVPYGEVWRTGANEATELTTTRDILFAGKPLEAGTYALFSIPRENAQWTIILNNQLGQWGAFEYNSTYDKFRVQAPAAHKETATEAFTIEFSEITGDSTSIIMQWDRTEVTIPIAFSDDEKSP